MARLLGECTASLNLLTPLPLLPAIHQEFMKISLLKGAQATTAIEGNTLSDEEIQQIYEKKGNIPPSKEYQAKEVDNVIRGLNQVKDSLIQEGRIQPITPGLIKDFHRMIGEGIGDAFAADPGKFRRKNVIVGPYRPPSFSKVEGLIDQLCLWLDKEFRFGEKQGQEVLEQSLIQAVAAHIYIAWIHPFSDGNGRTARLLEFYVLLRGGVPDIASHILSNHYNQTRSMYYYQISNAAKQKDLTDFLCYALQGFKEGLIKMGKDIADSQRDILWESLIYAIFDDPQETRGLQQERAKRIRTLILNWEEGERVVLNQKETYSKEMLLGYEGIHRNTLTRDLEFLREKGLLRKEGPGYCPNRDQLLSLRPARVSPQGGEKEREVVI